MATGGERRQRSGTQQGIEDTTVDYYDIMVIGKAGMGKSTTADKLLVASPTGHTYEGAEYSEPERKGERVSVDDLSIWLLADIPDELKRVQTRLKNIAFFRGLKDPHKEINEYHAEEQPNSGETPDFELISNDSTRMRVLDVPGFFGEQDAGASFASAGEKAHNSVKHALRRMRKILQIQTAMCMKFRRILYFLPNRGSLNRSDSYLETELTTLAKYFGKAIFECMIVVATLSAEAYEGGNPCAFSDKAMRKTKENFRAVLSRTLSSITELPEPPILFISMTSSCEEILQGVKTAQVVREPITLEFDSHICARCGSTAISVQSVKVAVYTDETESSTIPYNQSTCHPLFVPKYSKIVRFFRGVVYVVSLRSLCQNYLDESCVQCKEKPGSRGCTKVNTKYELDGEFLIVDHTNNTSEPIVFQSQDENDQSIPPLQGDPVNGAQTTTITPSVQGPTLSSSGVVVRETNVDNDPTDSHTYLETKGT